MIHPTIRAAGSSGIAATAWKANAGGGSPGRRRWRAMPHIAQIERNCEPRDLTCRRRQRQALLHWAYDSRTI
jgi:hypothetical protein